MSVCTFFGHRDCPETIRPKLHAALVELIEERGVDSFYVGNHGTFDRMVSSLLRELSERYPHILSKCIPSLCRENPCPIRVFTGFKNKKFYL